MSERQPTRRELLAAGGAAAGVFALAGCGGGEDPYALAKPPVPGADGLPLGEESRVPTACGQCPAGCGIDVRVVQGRAVRIDGLPDHPLNAGGIGPKGQAGLQMLYHPDRLRGPMRRVGPRGSGQLEPATWEQAIGAIATSLRVMRGLGEARSLVVVDGEPRGMARQLWERFCTAYGTPNHVDHRSATDGGKILAMAYMHGVADLPAYDWARTGYVLGFGASLYESWCQSIHLARAYSQHRRGVPGRRVKFVQVASRYSHTSSRADEWIPIEPATYGALALGIAHVLIAEALIDAEFVAAHTFGFDDWTDAAGAAHRGFKAMVLADYAPARVATLTGVPEATIARLAREMAEHRPAVALADGGAAAASNGIGTAMAIHGLNALLGNLERPGGLLVQRPAPLAPWAPVDQDEAARAGRAAPRLDGAGTPACALGFGRVQALPEAMLARAPYRARAVFLYRSNPIFSKPDGARWAEALQAIPLVVSFSPLPDESTAFADWILPDHTYLERWEVVEPVPGVGAPIVGLRRPVVAPLHDTRATGDVIVQLARALGAPVADAFPWATYRDAQVERLEGLHAADEAAGAEATDPESFVASLEERGGWWGAAPEFEQWDTAFRTPSGKFEFYAQGIAARLAQVFPEPGQLAAHLAALGAAGVTVDDLCLPCWVPPRFQGAPADYPLVLEVYRGIEYAEGGARHLPWIRETPLRGRRAWREWVEMAPVDAAPLGIRDGDAVAVETPAGSRVMEARLLESARPGLVAIALGHGRWPPGSGTVGAAGSAMSLVANHSGALCGTLALRGTRVRVRRIQA